MKPKKTAIAILMFALAAFAAHADEKSDALIRAALYNDAAEVRRLIADGADVNARDDDGWTALIYASGGGLEDYCVEPVKLLLAAGADVNAKNKNGFTALMKAVTNNFTEAEKLLLAAGADVNAKTHSGKTALMYAAEGGYAAKGGYVASVKLLIEAGADVNAKDEDGDTALMYAAMENSADVAELLLAAGADMNAKNYLGKTALIYAAQYNAADVARLLIAAGADLDVRSKYDKTALMYAAVKNYADVARLLLAAGADMNAKDNDGDTALMIAERRQYPKVVELLRAAARPPFSKEDVAAYIARAGNDGIWRAGRSSVLVERNKPATEYELDKIWDGDLATAWVEGVAGAGIGEYVTIGVQFPQLSFKKILSNVKVKGKLRMNNGFCRSEKLFKDNNRVKRALLTVYAVPLRAAKSGTSALDPGPLRLKEFEIAVADTSGLQVFDFDAEIPPRADVDGDGTVALFLRLTILDVYRGERYDDTCISELHATAEIAR